MHWSTLLLVATLLILGPATCAAARAGKIVVSVDARDCFQGKAYQPQYLTVAIFDASKVEHLLRSADALRAASNPTDAAGAGRMFGLRESLRAAIRQRSALARVNHSSRPALRVSIPRIQRIAVFGFASGEGEEEGFASAIQDVAAHGPNRVTLFFSTPAECGLR